MLKERPDSEGALVHRDPRYCPVCDNPSGSGKMCCVYHSNRWDEYKVAHADSWPNFITFLQLEWDKAYCIPCSECGVERKANEDYLCEACRALLVP